MSIVAVACVLPYLVHNGGADQRILNSAGVEKRAGWNIENHLFIKQNKCIMCDLVDTVPGVLCQCAHQVGPVTFFFNCDLQVMSITFFSKKKKIG